MRSRFWCAGGLAILLTATVLPCLTARADSEGRIAFPIATPESQGISSDALGRLSDTVHGFVNDEKIVGAELLVIKNRRTVLHEGIGWQDRDQSVRMQLHTIFNLRSMTKPIIGTAAQMLIDDGVLSPDTPAAAYLLSFNNDRSRTITVGDLLTHRSGLAWEYHAPGKNETLKDIADYWGRRGPEEFLPGTGFQYSDGGANSLGAILSEASNTSLDNLVEERILAPLGMNDTFAPNGKRAIPQDRCASRYVIRDGQWESYWQPGQPEDAAFLRGAQGLLGTPMDYARFLTLWMDGGVVGQRRQRLLSTAAIQRGLTPVSLTDFSTGFPGRDVYYGQDWMLYYNVQDESEMTSAIWGHDGSEGTHCWVWPDRDLMILYFTQSRGNPTGIQIERAINELLIEPTNVTRAVPSKYEPYCGLYWSERDNMFRAVTGNGDKLAIEIPGVAEFELIPTDVADVWELVGPPEGRIHFVRNSAGKITGMTPPAFTQDSHNPRIEPDDSLPSIDELLALHSEAHGLEQLNRLGAFRMTGTMNIAVHRLSGRNTLVTDGRRSRETVQFSGMEAQTTVVGEDRAWRVSPVSGLTELDNAEREQARLRTVPAAIGDWQDLYRELRVVRRTTVGGRDVYLVRGTPFAAAPMTHFVDVATGLVLKTISIPKVPGSGPVGLAVSYEDYRDVDGVRIPFRITGSYADPRLGQYTIQYDTFEARLPATDEVFNVDTHSFGR